MAKHYPNVLLGRACCPWVWGVLSVFGLQWPGLQCLTDPQRAALPKVMPAASDDGAESKRPSHLSPMRGDADSPLHVQSWPWG